MFFQVCLNSTTYSSINILSPVECIPQGSQTGICYFVYALFISNMILLLTPPASPAPDEAVLILCLPFVLSAPGLESGTRENGTAAGLICYPHLTEDRVI